MAKRSDIRQVLVKAENWYQPRGEIPRLVETDFSPGPVLWFTPCCVDRFLVSGANRLGVSIWLRQMLFA